MKEQRERLKSTMNVSGDLKFELSEYERFHMTGGGCNSENERAYTYNGGFFTIKCC